MKLTNKGLLASEHPSVGGSERSRAESQRFGGSERRIYMAYNRIEYLRNTLNIKTLPIAAIIDFLELYWKNIFLVPVLQSLSPWRLVWCSRLMPSYAVLCAGNASPHILLTICSSLSINKNGCECWQRSDRHITAHYWRCISCATVRTPCPPTALLVRELI